ncbi:MFS transporter [Streptomyces sp. NPDC058385]|uniref:MFS transporter n=1 Tax=Streptomyces sp. NPDC058385 TaxID=3346473 RepID=UPI00364A8CAB
MRRKLVADEKMGRRAGIAAFIGTTIEWYDFYIFGTASAIVLGKLFFPEASPAVGVLASFATFWIGFVARPLGSIVFGHLGDRIGRKNTLIATLLLMGVATAGMGLLPTYDTVGVLAPVLLVLLRVMQGVAVGGEWGGAVLIATEHTERRRGFLFGAFAQQGSPTGQILAVLAFTAVSQLPDAAFVTWGWRLPFLASALLVIVGLIVRMRIQESPELLRLKQTEQVARLPLVELLRTHKATVALGLAASVIAYVASYLKNTFALSWATNDLGMSRDSMLTIILLATVAQFVAQPFGAVLGSRWNTRKVVTVLLILEIPAMPVLFWLISTRSFGLTLLGMIIATLPHVMFYALLAGMLAQAFPARVRYTGISVSYSAAGMLFGGGTPLIGQALLTATGSIVPVVAFAVLMVLLSLFGARALLARTAAAEEREATTADATQQPAAL